jgi:hypothetical protein
MSFGGTPIPVRTNSAVVPNHPRNRNHPNQRSHRHSRTWARH